MTYKGIFIVFVTVLILLLFLLQFSSKQSIELFATSNEEELTCIPDEHVDNMYDITKFMVNFFKRHDIHYWAIGGTLIGALRNYPPGPIRWDDDVDVAILSSERKKLIRAMKTDKEFKKTIKFTLHDFGYQLGLKNDTCMYKDYYFDIFIYKKRMGKHGLKYYSVGTGYWDDFYYNSKSEFYPVKSHPFWDFKISVPNDLRTVQRGYDDDVLSFGLVENHTGGGKNIVNLYDNINSCSLVPMLSKNLMTKLKFKT